MNVNAVALLKPLARTDIKLWWEDIRENKTQENGAERMEVAHAQGKPYVRVKMVLK